MDRVSARLCVCCVCIIQRVYSTAIAVPAPRLIMTGAGGSGGFLRARNDG